MKELQYEDLKQGFFTSPQSGSTQFKRYIIEDVNDLNKFREKFPKINQLNMYNQMFKSLESGMVVLATDEHPMTRMPTYCFESNKDSLHPSSIHRVK
jgi:hypothetical protein